MTDENNNARDIYVCIYDKNNIGLFKRIQWRTRIHKNAIVGNNYNSGNIYIGIDTDHIGMEKTHEDYFSTESWEPIGTYVKYDKKKYISDCKIEQAVNIDTIRFYMYSKGKIESYIPGKANGKELLDILENSYEFFNLDIDKVKFNKRIY